IGLSLALLSGMALVIRSAATMQAIDLGYDLKPLTQASFINRAAASTTVRYVDVENEMLSRIHALPDVAGAATAMRRSMLANATTVADAGGDKRELMTPLYQYLVVSPNYLRTLRIPVVKGRDFTDGVASE